MDSISHNWLLLHNLASSITREFFQIFDEMDPENQQIDRIVQAQRQKVYSPQSTNRDKGEEAEKAFIGSYIKSSSNKLSASNEDAEEGGYPRDINTIPTEEDLEELWAYGNAPLPYLSLRMPPAVKEWAYSAENGLIPYADTILFIIDIIPTLLMCNLLALMAYSQFDEVAVELQCLNKAFTGFKLLWNKDEYGNPMIVDRVFDFTEYGYA